MYYIEFLWTAFSELSILSQFYFYVSPLADYIYIKQNGGKKETIDQGKYHHYYTTFVFINLCYKYRHVLLISSSFNISTSSSVSNFILYYYVTFIITFTNISPATPLHCQYGTHWKEICIINTNRETSRHKMR